VQYVACPVNNIITEENHLKICDLQEHEDIFIQLLKDLAKRDAYLIKHADEVKSVSFHPTDDNLVISTGDDGKIKLVTRDTRTIRKVWDPDFNFLGIAKPQCVSFSPDGGSSIAVGFGLGDIKVFDVATGAEKRTLVGHESLVFSIAWSPDTSSQLLASGSQDETLRIWHVGTGREVMAPIKGRIFFSVAFSSDGMLLASGNLPGAVHIWDVRTDFNKSKGKVRKMWDVITSRQERLVCILRGHTNRVSSLAFSSDGKYLASASYDGTIKIWDAAMLQEEANAEKKMMGVVQGIWNIVTGSHRSLFRSLKGHKDQVGTIAFSPNSKLLASGGIFDRNIIIWDVPVRGRVVTTRLLRGHTGGVTCVSFSNDSTLVASASVDKTVKIWDVQATPASAFIRRKDNDDIPCSVTHSPNGKLVAAAQESCFPVCFSIRIFDTETGQGIGRITPPPRKQFCKCFMAWSLNSKLLACTDGRQGVQIWDVKKSQEAMPALFRAEHASGSHKACVAFSPDSERLAVGGKTHDGDGYVWIWDLQRKQLAMPPWSGHLNEVTSVSWSPDGKYLASGGGRLPGKTVGSEEPPFDFSVRIWDAATGREVTRLLYEHASRIYKVSFSPDGKYVASGSEDDKSIKIWDARSGREVMEPLKGNSFCWAIESYVGAGGRYLAAADDDQVLVYMLMVGANFLPAVIVL
jgi:WD40 repeat protein